MTPLAMTRASGASIVPEHGEGAGGPCGVSTASARSLATGGPCGASTASARRLPAWVRQELPHGPLYLAVIGEIESGGLHTVCQEARCPNRTACWSAGTLTFQILGALCTRRCGFCAEETGRPNAVDWSEPEKVAAAAAKLGLKHVVVTAPARDDLADGGAALFAAAVTAVRARNPGVSVEVLTSDLRGDRAALETVFASRPDIFNHNLETVRRLTPEARPSARYDRSLEVLRMAAEEGRLAAKSGLMVGLGESREELLAAFEDLRRAGCSLLTVGQYLAPSSGHLPIRRFYTIKDFSEIKEAALGMGFSEVFSGPLVRSSYDAGAMMEKIKR